MMRAAIAPSLANNRRDWRKPAPIKLARLRMTKEKFMKMNRMVIWRLGEKSRSATSLAIAIVMTLALGLSNSAFATVVEKKSFNDLVLEAQMVAIGRVTTVESHPTLDHKYAYTYVTVGNLEVLKGSYREPAITLRLDGGLLGDGRTLVIDGMPRFRSGEKVVLFVKGNGQYACPFVGWWQGLLRVEADNQSGKEVVKTSGGHPIQKIDRGDFLIRPKVNQRATGDTAGTADEAQVPTSQGAAEATADLSLEELKSQVSDLLSGAGARGRAVEEVKSAEIKLDSPAPRITRKLAKEN
jgi:hypothetical protein